MASVLDRRIAWRLLPLLVGALFGQGRRTVASWLRGGELGHEYRLYYYFLGSLGRNIKSVAGVLLGVRHGLQLSTWVWYTCGRSSLTHQ